MGTTRPGTPRTTAGVRLILESLDGRCVPALWAGSFAAATIPDPAAPPAAPTTVLFNGPLVTLHADQTAGRVTTVDWGDGLVTGGTLTPTAPGLSTVGARQKLTLGTRYHVTVVLTKAGDPADRTEVDLLVAAPVDPTYRASKAPPSYAADDVAGSVVRVVVGAVTDVLPIGPASPPAVPPPPPPTVPPPTAATPTPGPPIVPPASHAPFEAGAHRAALQSAPESVAQVAPFPPGGGDRELPAPVPAPAGTGTAAVRPPGDFLGVRSGGSSDYAVPAAVRVPAAVPPLPDNDDRRTLPREAGAVRPRADATSLVVARNSLDRGFARPESVVVAAGEAGLSGEPDATQELLAELALAADVTAPLAADPEPEREHKSSLWALLLAALTAAGLRELGPRRCFDRPDGS